MSYENENPIPDDLSFDFDTTGIKDEKEIQSGGGPIPDGKYHVVVDSVEKDHQSQNPCLKFTFTILAGTVPNQVNRKLHERLFLTEKAKNRTVLFANRLGLITANDLDKTHVRKNWGDARGQQCIVEVATREYEKKDGTKGKASNITFGGIWKMSDPEVADVPRAGAAARMASATQATPGTASRKAADAFDDL